MRSKGFYANKKSVCVCVYIYINYVASNGYEKEIRMLLYDTTPPFVGRSEINEVPQGRRDGIWLCLDKLSLLHYQKP